MLIQERERLRVSHLVQQTQVLGPGQRAVIWVHGCCFDCPGCLAEHYKTGPYKEYSPQELAQWYLSVSGTKGLTISGGEPMLQADLLAQMVRKIRLQQDTGVIVYTGFTYEMLLEKAKTEAGIRAFLNEIDLLIDGPYMQEQDKAQPYRGSENQRIIPLTGRYLSDLDGYYGAERGRKIEISFSAEQTVMVGVPDRDQLAIWQKIKAMGEVQHGSAVENL